MRILLTADLHFNHPRSRPLAAEVIEKINNTGGDVLVVIGDTAVADGDSLEQCLSLFRFAGPKLFITGNHELWTNRPDSYAIFRDELPGRVRGMGWRWLEDEPYVSPNRQFAIVGSIGWYDYSFAQPNLGIPRRFYEAKISPGAAARLTEHAHLLDKTDDIPPHAMEIFARWNDGRNVRLHRSDEQFLVELLHRLCAQLDALKGIPTIVAATHHLPFAELLPPPHSFQWDFAKAYLGSGAIGDLLSRYEAVRHLFCGHSHYPAAAEIGGIRATNIGSGYRFKTFKTLDLRD